MPSLRMLRNLKNELKLNRVFDEIKSAPEVTPYLRHYKQLRLANEILNLDKREREEFCFHLNLRLGLHRFNGQVFDLSIPSPDAGKMAAMMSAASASAGAPVAAAAADARATSKTKSTFDIKLEKYDANAKIKIIKEVRSFTDLGLKEAKELVEKTPAVLKKGLSKEEADAIVAKLKELGATAVVE